MNFVLKIIFKVFRLYLLVIVGLGLLYWVVPPFSTLMLARYVTMKPVMRESVSLEQISPNVLKAVITAEDDQFCTHWGIDWKSMSNAVEKASDGKHSHGASTISMQVAKNLFLWPDRSYLRKAIEIPIALYLETIWSKKRMMEVYLSIAEWGDGVFGIEAAAQKYFRKSAKQLSSYEAALLAAALPNPLRRNSAHPSGYQLGYAASISKRMNYGVDLSCFK